MVDVANAPSHTHSPAPFAVVFVGAFRRCSGTLRDAGGGNKG